MAPSQYQAATVSSQVGYASRGQELSRCEPSFITQALKEEYKTLAWCCYLCILCSVKMSSLCNIMNWFLSTSTKFRKCDGTFADLGTVHIWQRRVTMSTSLWIYMNRSELHVMLLSIIFVIFGSWFLGRHRHLTGPRSKPGSTQELVVCSQACCSWGRGLFCLSFMTVGGMDLTYRPNLDLLCKNSQDINESLK